MCYGELTETNHETMALANKVYSLWSPRKTLINRYISGHVFSKVAMTVPEHRAAKIQLRPDCLASIAALKPAGFLVRQFHDHSHH